MGKIQIPKEEEEEEEEERKKKKKKKKETTGKTYEKKAGRKRKKVNFHGSSNIDYLLYLTNFFFSLGTCPPGTPQVRCAADPCKTKTCPNNPDAKCVANYCGGCNAEFFDEDDERIEDCGGKTIR